MDFVCLGDMPINDHDMLKSPVVGVYLNCSVLGELLWFKGILSKIHHPFQWFWWMRMVYGGAGMSVSDSQGQVRGPCQDTLYQFFLVHFQAVLKLSILIYFLTIIIIMDYDNGNGSKRSKQNLTDMAKEPKYINTYSVSHFLTVWLRTSYIKSIFSFLPV